MVKQITLNNINGCFAEEIDTSSYKEGTSIGFSLGQDGAPAITIGETDDIFYESENEYEICFEDFLRIIVENQMGGLEEDKVNIAYEEMANILRFYAGKMDILSRTAKRE